MGMVFGRDDTLVSKCALYENPDLLFCTYAVLSWMVGLRRVIRNTILTAVQHSAALPFGPFCEQASILIWNYGFRSVMYRTTILPQ